MIASKPNILLGSPVRQSPEVLKEFLSSVSNLPKDQFNLDIFFLENNEESLSTDMLLEFKEQNNNTRIEQVKVSDVYARNDHTHYWNEQLIWKVADYKNQIIDLAIDENYDYLFLVDSDLILHPDTIDWLLKADKDIISEIFWTKWQPEAHAQPQVWVSNEYTQFDQQRGEHLTEQEKEARYMQFLTKLRIPGVYEVGGLGACTLISRKALLAGVNFKQIKNLSFWGEDRHFCIRAGALGLSMHVDTHVPPLHLYRASDLEQVEAYKKSWKTPNSQVQVITKGKPKLTLSMVVKNESGRYLKKALEAHRKFIDEAVIIDDASTDDSVAVCLEVLKDIPIRMVQNEESKFGNEVELRKQQWEETISTNPDWILNLDADEIFEDKFADEVHKLLEQDEFDLYSFRLYDFWNLTHYREDEYWQAHLYYRPFLLRYRKDFDYTWKDTPQHCGRYPQNIFDLPNSISQLRLKHLGWVNEQERLQKFERYKTLDPGAKYGDIRQYTSILDGNPQLIEWQEY
ncbi:glycosyltransferase [Viridibacillus sp. NPDC096237]|uniref:glycosyltransferase n=1 Tax=Viridibacillus sp. NPDC096237 TaxID=3390721 RepID=UPI003CFC856D